MAAKIESEPEREVGRFEIQKYLDEFNEELEQGESREESAKRESDPGTYFIDEDGQLYFQPAGDDSNGVESETPAEDRRAVDGDDAEGRESVSYLYIVEEGEEDKPEAKEENDITVYDFDEDNDENVSAGADREREADKRGAASKKAKRMHYCPHCDYCNSKRILVHKHMVIHSDEKPYKCFICARGFRTVASLTNHENTHTGNKPFRCRVCSARFTTSGEIVRHVRYRHSKFRPHKCNECDYAAVELSKLRRHQRSHTGERPYQCPHCTYASPDTFKLKRHLRVHTGERPYKCNICCAAFSQSNSLKTHRLTHFPEQRPVYQCALCPVTCGRKADLRGHISKLHTASKPYECKRCGKHLPDRYSYKTHIRSHSGEKSFKCNVCSYASVSKMHLASHMYIHTNEKPYECDQCDYRSRQKQLLKRHKNFYHTPGFVPPEASAGSHECEVCQKKFIHVGNLIKHLAVHDPDSNVHEKKKALKMGRKCRVSTANDEEIINELPSVTKVEGFEDDEQHYVVFEMVDADDEEPEEAGAREPDGQSAPQDAKMDMENCFGFDEEEDDDRRDEDEDESVK